MTTWIQTIDGDLIRAERVEAFGYFEGDREKRGSLVIVATLQDGGGCYSIKTVDSEEDARNTIRELVSEAFPESCIIAPSLFSS